MRILSQMKPFTLVIDTLIISRQKNKISFIGADWEEVILNLLIKTSIRLSI